MTWSNLQEKDCSECLHLENGFERSRWAPVVVSVRSEDLKGTEEVGMGKEM